MAVARGPRERGESTRRRILDAARRLAAERGYQGTTLAMIQREAGVHPGSLYWFFADKDALFAALVESSYRDAQDASVVVGDSPNPVRSVLQGIVDNPARFGLWRFNVQLMLDAELRDSKTAQVIRALRVDSQNAMVASWLSVLPEEVVARRPELPSQLADHALACVEGCILARVAGRPVDEGAVTTHVSRVLDTLVQDACRAAGVPTPEAIRDRIASTRNGEESAWAGSTDR